MSQIPSWLGAIGALIVIATALAAAVAVYKTTVQGALLTAARATIIDLRGEINDGERRETRLEGDIKVLKSEKDAAKARIKILEDLITKRQDDDEIRKEIAAVKKVVDENVLGQLTAIFGLLEGGTSSPEGGK